MKKHTRCYVLQSVSAATLALVMSLGCTSLPTGGFGLMMPTGEHFTYGYYKADLGEIEVVEAFTNRGDFAFAKGGLGSNTRVVQSPDLRDVSAYKGREIPEWIDIHWRKHPVPGSPPGTGEPVGPFRVQVRERIPKDVLELVRGANHEHIELIFMIRNDGVDFKWELWDYPLGVRDGKPKLLRSSPATYPDDRRAKAQARDAGPAPDLTTARADREDQATRELFTLLESERTAADIDAIKRALANADIEGRSAWERSRPERQPRLYTPLMLAAASAPPDVVALLIKHGAQVNAANTEGSTPLIYAVLAGRADNVKLLLKHGADTSARNRNGETALSLARQQGFDDVAALLERAPRAK